MLTSISTGILPCLSTFFIPDPTLKFLRIYLWISTMRKTADWQVYIEIRYKCILQHCIVAVNAASYSFSRTFIMDLYPIRLHNSVSINATEI